MGQDFGEGDNSNLARCNTRDQSQKCKKDMLIDPVSQFEVINDEPLTVDKGVENPVQLRPQKVSLTNMRVGNQIKLTNPK